MRARLKEDDEKIPSSICVDFRFCAPSILSGGFVTVKVKKKERRKI
jgi:hypothetical protein